MYVAKLREYSATLSTSKAVTQAIDYCISHNILRDFFLKERKAITMVSLYEYDRAGHMALVKEEAFEDGIIKGIEDGKSQMQQLFDILASENRIDDIQRACRDTEFLDKLLKEYDIKN